MITSYKFIIPYIPDMGSVQPIFGRSSTLETAAQNALWQLNNMRDHDGLPPLKGFPKGTERVPVYSIHHIPPSP